MNAAPDSGDQEVSPLPGCGASDGGSFEAQFDLSIRHGVLIRCVDLTVQ